MSILGIVTKQNASSLLLKGLKVSQSGTSDDVGLGMITTQRRFSLLVSSNWQTLQDVLSTRPTPLPLGIAYHAARNELSIDAQPQLEASEEVALVYTGTLDNAQYLRKKLQNLGYHFENQNHGKVVLHLLNRYLYLEQDISPLEAMSLALARLQGDFALIILFLQPEPLLLAACRGHSLALGVYKDSLYVGSDLSVLKALCYFVVQLGEGNPMVLSSSTISLASLSEIFPQVDCKWSDKLDFAWK